ncbi:PAS domain S-box-containing protein [Dyella sp. OK004]|uniref:sensor histidine kinase n=1 Tax=Dyella sp. OK004 TaxID=1855292 RepID=UPI0008E15163|nr:histidine kinase [Dyella sp. OK004]SFS13710.1 PAS domain S-box-containing protein [Dyella sp. OK004]
MVTEVPGQHAEHRGATLSGDLQSWEKSFRIAIDTIPGLAWFGSADGPVEFLNRQWCEYTGIPMDDALGWGWTATIHPDDLPGLEKEWRGAMEHGAPGELEARVRGFDGEYRWFLFRYAPLLDDAGQVLKWYGSNIDIEARKHAERALLASEQLARGQVNALKSALDTLAMESDPNQLVAHILRTLTAQFGAHSASVWRRGLADGTVGIEFVFEDDLLVPKTDPRFAGLDLVLPMEDIWPWPEVFRSGEPSVIEDIRTVPPFPLRDRLLPLGIITVLLVPMMIAGRLEGAIGLRFKQQRIFQTEQVELAQALTNQAMLMIRLAELSAQSREAAVVGERNRIARDIHDTLAQGFTGVIVQLEAAEDASRRGLGREAEQHVITARNLARESLSEARRSVQALRPQPLEEGGITNALRVLFEKLTAGVALQAEFRLLGIPHALPPEWEANLFRIAQEVLTNALRHAQASHIVATIAFGSDDVRLEFIDDGRGFDPAARSEGYGLLGMRERVDAMNGQMEVRSSKGGGTEVSIRLPAASPDASGQR